MASTSVLPSLFVSLLQFVLVAGGILLLGSPYGDRLTADWPGWWRPVAYCILVISLLNLTAAGLGWLYRRREFGKRRGSKNFLYGVENIRKLLLFFVVVLTFFTLLGVDIRALLTSLSIVAAAIAIISKDFVNDLIVGLYYSFNDVFEVGDYVKFSTYRGRVVDIGLVKTKILNDNDDLVILPNGKIYSGEIVNYTRRDINLMSLDFELDLKRLKDIETLERELRDILKPYAAAIDPKSYLLKIMEVHKDYLELKYQFRLEKQDSVSRRQLKRSVARAVLSHVTRTHLDA